MPSDVPFLIEDLTQAVVTGLLVGGVYALISMGLALIFGVMRVVNFAQGDFMMLGMYFTLYAVAGVGVNVLLGPVAGPLLAALAAGPALFIVAWFLHRFVVSRVTGTGRGGQDAQLILTLGISLVAQNVGLIAFGSSPQTVRTPTSARAWLLGFLVLNQARAIAFVAALALAAALYLFLERTRAGKVLRAAADNPEAATYMGIDVDRAHRLAFAVGIGLTAMAGGLVATYYSFQPYVGLDFVIIMFVSVVLGGLGSISGAFFGGIIIGLVQQVSTVFLPIQLQNATLFVVFLLVLFLRPQGLLGRLAERT